MMNSGVSTTGNWWDYNVVRNDLSGYIADYINEELSRGNQITKATIQDAMEAFEGGAR